MKKKNDFGTRTGVLGAALLALAVFTVLHWLWTDAFLYEFHSDTADMLLAAASARDAGAIASPTFHYSYFIPFGDRLLYRLFLPSFGVSVTTIRCGMTIFAGLFAGAALLLFRSFRWSRGICCAAAAFLLCIASATAKMREIYFGHTLFYSLGTLFFFLGCAIAPTLDESPVDVSRRTRMLRAGLFALCMAWAAACGKPLLLYAVLPVLGGALLVRMGDARPMDAARSVRALLPGALGTMAGLAVFSSLSRSLLPIEYTEFYEWFSQPERWWENLARLPMRWILLLCDFPEGAVSIASGAGLPIALQIAGAVLLGAAPIFALLRIDRFSERERLLLAGHWILATGILFYWIFGTVSDANWRLCPLVLSAAAVTAVLLKNELSAASGSPFFRRATVCAAVFFAALWVLLELQTLFVPADRDVWFGEGTLISTIQKTGVREGYCTDFWFANAPTVVTDERLRLRQVVRSNGEWKGRSYISDDRWFSPDPDRKKTIFVCHPHEEQRAPKEGLTARHECNQFDFRNDRFCPLVVLVYDGDCLHRNESER